MPPLAHVPSLHVLQPGVKTWDSARFWKFFLRVCQMTPCEKKTVWFYFTSWEQKTTKAQYNKKHQEKTLKAKVKANIISLTWSPKTRDLEIKNILEKSLRCPQQGVGSLSSQQQSTTFTAMINLDVFAVGPKQRATHASKYTCLNRFLFRVALLDSTIKIEIWKLVKTRNLFWKKVRLKQRNANMADDCHLLPKVGHYKTTASQ